MDFNTEPVLRFLSIEPRCRLQGALGVPYLTLVVPGVEWIEPTAGLAVGRQHARENHSIGRSGVCFGRRRRLELLFAPAMPFDRAACRGTVLRSPLSLDQCLGCGGGYE